MSLLSLFQTKKESTGIFIPDGSRFVELKSIPGKGSIDDIAFHLGYNIDQFYVHNNYCSAEIEPVRSVVFEVFTQNIIFILTTKIVIQLKQPQVKKALQTFKLTDALDSYTVSNQLDNAIVNKNMTVEFLARVLDLKGSASNGLFYTSKLDLHLYFNNGLLTDYQSADGLRTAARYRKQYDPYSLGCCEIEAQLYWGDDIGKILKEVNIQSDAWAQVPEGNKNEYINLHFGGNDTVNYKMLMVYHYNQPITLKEFLEVNHGRYKTIGTDEQTNTKRLATGNFYYDFNLSGKLMSKGKLS